MDFVTLVLKNNHHKGVFLPDSLLSLPGDILGNVQGGRGLNARED